MTFDDFVADAHSSSAALRKFGGYATRACRSRETISTEFKELHSVVLALEDSLKKMGGTDPGEEYGTAIRGVILKCPKCGVLNDDVRSSILMVHIINQRFILLLVI